MTTIDVSDPKQVTRILGRTRLVAGLSLLIAPRLAGPVLGVAPRTAAGRWFARAFGVREAVLGLGMEMSVREGRFPQGWVGLAGVADLGEAITGVVTRGIGRRARLGAIASAASAAYHLQLARRLDELDVGDSAAP